jgi:hypothetical protein
MSSIVKTPVIGIPSWDWKKKAVKYSIKNPNIHLMDISNFCYECTRHSEMLSIFDNHGDCRVSEYYNYYKKDGYDDHFIIKKIDKFKSLYEHIIKNRCDVCSIVTEDGCRLDGSHRLSILLHTGVRKANVNVFVYSYVFNINEEDDIRKQVIRYRKEIYNIE